MWRLTVLVKELALAVPVDSDVRIEPQLQMKVTLVIKCQLPQR